MVKEILTDIQKQFILLFASYKNFSRGFYLTGGTALAAYYLNHRYSEDLDFFTLKEIDLLSIETFLKQIKKQLKIKKTDFQQSFNRNIFFLHCKKEILKIEFTYFPFDHIENPIQKDGIYIDSLLDIAVNKAFTISQQPRSRDFIDLYLILKKYKKLSFPKLIKLARIKFNWQIDPIQLGAQLLKVNELKDLPRMIHKIDNAYWKNFFLEQAKSLSKNIFK